MDKYIESEAVLGCFHDWVDRYGDVHSADEMPEFGRIEALPAADVAPVVRCRDCRHRDPENHKCDCGWPERAGCMFAVGNNYFCAYGERR